MINRSKARHTSLYTSTSVCLNGRCNHHLHESVVVSDFSSRVHLRVIESRFKNFRLNTKEAFQQGRIHGYLSRVRLGRGSNKSLQASKQQNPQSKIDVTNGLTDQPTNGLTMRLIELRACD